MNKVVKNYIYNLSYQILVLIVPLITTPYISRVLGAKGVGTFSYINSIVQYFILFGCVGLNLYGQREIAYHQNDRVKRDQIFWELVFIRIITMSLSLILFLFTFVSFSQYSAFFMLMSLDIIAAMFDISWFFQGIENFKIVVVRNLLIRIIGIVLMFLFVKSKHDLNIYIICHSITLLVGNFSMWICIPKFIDKAVIDQLELKRHLKQSVILFIPQIATSIYTVLDKTMVGAITGIEEEVAFYEQGQRIIKIAMTLVISLGTVMLPRVANLYKNNRMEKINEYLIKSFQFVFFLSFPMMFGLIAISCNLVPWFFGDGYAKVIPNMMIISPIIVIISLSNIMGTQLLLPTGRQKEFTLSVVVGCGVNFILNLLLIPSFLSIGAALATIFAEIAVTSVQIVFTRKDFNFKNIVKNNSKYIFSSIIMFGPIYLLAINLSPSIINTFICVVAGSVIYVVVLLIMKEEQIISIIKVIKKKMIEHVKIE